ncbi:hypothetical protein [Chloroflexus aggregans]|uniref:hypothetical protein n=1 Tax=Chloroflexus aggregans TaxID=152260 RepID=UPI0012EE887E|nr:hypothetical protein [Chloroflexus aggregans]
MQRFGNGWLAGRIGHGWITMTQPESWLAGDEMAVHLAECTALAIETQGIISLVKPPG